LPDVFAAIRTSARRLVGQEFEVRGKMVKWEMVPFDVQLIGGIILHQGKIAEMKTGEGKTLVCTLPVILNALTGQGVHVVTVNDYLAQRDSEWMRPLYDFCGLSVGVVIHNKSTVERREAYASDITYGTNNEFGFDYLRDNMAQSPEDLVQRKLHFAIVDEVDSILIDEARTPLIISAPAEESTDKYVLYADLIPQLRDQEDYVVDFKLKSVTLTEQGVFKLEKLLQKKDLFTESGFEEVHHIENALKAKVVFEIDRDYVVQNGQVLIVDEFTGRLMPGRRYSDGLHQALEAKEHLEIQRESKTLATVTFQNYFRLYEKLAGMTGTAETEAEEFAKIYHLDTIAIPTHRDLARKDFSDMIFKNERGKFQAIVQKVKELHHHGQPVLIGTINIDKSELLSHLLRKEVIPHEVLNAKQHEREAEIVSKAGQMGAVTIATNMAGRGTDIKLGEGVREKGGLFILGTERHESRRIDNQLRGRSGRQGDPGASQFFISMQDDLMRRFGGEKMMILMDRLQIPDDEPIENAMISRSVEGAQKKIEGFHFDARKHVVQYDDVMNIHREKIYTRRRRLLGSESITEDLKQLVVDFVQEFLDAHLSTPKLETQEEAQSLLDLIFGLGVDVSQISVDRLLKIQDKELLVPFLFDLIWNTWENKRNTLPEEEQDRVTRFVLLHSIDELWLEHINEMTNLKDRVALSGYAQKDPVIEYKREGFEMFRQLLSQIRRATIQNLFRIQFLQQAPVQSVRRPLEQLQTNAHEILEELQGKNSSSISSFENKLSRKERRKMERDRKKW